MAVYVLHTREYTISVKSDEAAGPLRCDDFPRKHRKARRGEARRSSQQRTIHATQPKPHNRCAAGQEVSHNREEERRILNQVALCWSGGGSLSMGGGT